jgi:hypothetical protein
VTVELLNIEWCREKKLIELRSRLDHGLAVFVEDNDPKTKFEELKWHVALSNEHNFIKLHINTTKLFGDDNAESSLPISIHKHKTLLDLK